MRPSNRFFLSLECATVLFACSAGFGSYEVSRLDPPTKLVYLFVVGIPATASILFTVLGTLVPGIMAVGRIRFPLNITAPLMFAGLTLASVVLWTTPNLALVDSIQIQSYGLVWTRPLQLGLVALAQCAVLTFLTALREDPKSTR